MYQTCPATGRIFHDFNKETHRCACGRWQRGFAPKKVAVRPRAECQVCENQQAVDTSGRMMLHGYQRPGYGYTIGKCFGVNHLPYPATDALVMWLGWLQERHEDLQASALQVPERTTLIVRDYNTKNGTKPIHKADFMDPAKPWLANEWQGKLDSLAWEIGREIERTESEMARVDARIVRAGSV